MNFIEVYDNALPDDICDYVIALFDREDNMSYGSKVIYDKMSYSPGYDNQRTEEVVTDVRTMIDPSEGPTHYVSARHMKLHPSNYLYDSVISDLDYVMQEKIFDYNNKYHVWSSKLNMDLIPDSDEKKLVEEEAESSQYLSDIIYRHGDYQVKKYTPPNDGFHIWHTDWGPMPEFIGRVLAAQFYLNDVEEGGETEFYHQKRKIKSKKGRLAIWPIGFTHTHRGNNPISNAKYVVTVWFTQRNVFR